MSGRVKASGAFGYSAYSNTATAKTQGYGNPGGGIPSALSLNNASALAGPLQPLPPGTSPFGNLLI